MAFNPMELMKLKERLELFGREHPRFAPFLSTVEKSALREGSVLEIRVTTPEGKEYVTNIRLTKDDVESVNLVKGLKQ